ncbi:hypothetical protein M9Y10_035333 [Tritrichomonas musculus]|uniref:Uncharacterized protein n=1 Tax=Tritrichomonas musculus TaxID=1915356 RepID=A0ABR2KIG3_9EUKA
MLLEQIMNDSSLEQNYQELISQNPELVIHFLIQIIQESPDSKLSQFSIILFGRNISVFSQDFLSIGTKEFHDFVIKNVFSLLNNPAFSPFSLSLISDLISRLILVYSYAEDFDPKIFFIPIMEIIASQNINNSSAAINALVYSICNKSINYQPFSEQTSDFLHVALTNNQINGEIILPSLRLLYLTFDSVSFDFREYLPAIFDKLKNDNDLLNQSVHDIITYLPSEKYTFFSNISNYFILFFLSILGSPNRPTDLEYCLLEIVYNFSNTFFNECSILYEPLLNNIFLFLSNYEAEDKESKFIISKIADKYGGLVQYSLQCYKILTDALSKDTEFSINEQIAAMNLFSYSFKGIFIHLSIELPDEYFEAIVQSGVMDSPNQLVRIAAFNMLCSMFKNFSFNGSTFHPMLIYQKMIESIENQDFPIVLISKFKAFEYYLDNIPDNELEELCPVLTVKFLHLTQNTTPDCLIHILHSIETLFIKLPNNDFSIFRQLFLNILGDPSKISFSIYIMVLSASFHFNDFPSEAFISAFSYIFQSDFNMLTKNDLDSIALSVYRICESFPSCAIMMFNQFIELALNGAANDVEYTSIPLQKASTMLNLKISMEKQNNSIKNYNISQIQLIVFYLKILRYTLSMAIEIPQEFIQRYGDAIYFVLSKWSSINFSDQIQYNALKTIHIFFILTQYKFPYAPLLEQLLNFTISTTKNNRLLSLYKIIYKIFIDITMNNLINEDIIKNSFFLYTHELEKMMLRRKKIRELLDLGDCKVSSNEVFQHEESLGKISLPLLSNPNFHEINFSDLVFISMNTTCVTTTSFLSFYFIFKERKIEILNHLIQIYIPQTDQEEKEKEKDPFFFLDSKYAGFFLVKIINEKILQPNEISILIDTFNQREKIKSNGFLFATITLLIMDKYRTGSINLNILIYLMKVDYFSCYDIPILKFAFKSWNNIFQCLCQQSFDIPILARLFAIHSNLERFMQDDVFNLQKESLLNNFNGDQEQLKNEINILFKMKPE